MTNSIIWKRKVKKLLFFFYSLWVLKKPGTATNKEPFACGRSKCVFVRSNVSAWASVSNCTSSVLSSLLNYILFVPLGAEGSCKLFGTALPLLWHKTSFSTANPSVALATWDDAFEASWQLQHYLQHAVQQISPLKRQPAVHCGEVLNAYVAG